MFRSRSASTGDMKTSRSMMDFRSVQQVPTFRIIREVPTTDSETTQHENLPQEVDINNIKTDHDLETLKKQDPFLYYSIPAAKKAEFLNRKVEVSKLDKCSGIRRNSNSCPARMMTESRHTRRSILRSTRISFECHDNLKLEYLAELAELVDDEETVDSGDEKEEDESDDDDDDGFDPMLNVFASIDE
mmetsp:Transcript_27247/g.56832  ORF Transcript_27247/g.56832 Transcript_27247/m.56832 type:complete len:188 (+) Transcript_27247:98-661(+)